jgi:putative phosphoesterase
MKRPALAPPRTVHTREELRFEGDAASVVVVADTHGRPHPDLAMRIAAIAPARILHAGDVGDLDVLRALEKQAPVIAVRGNIDGHELPDFVTLDVARGADTLITILLTHIAVYGPRLRADVARIARAHQASLVVCGHSHVPFVGSDRGVTMFNPGSAGPRRFRLPILFGVIDLTPTGVSVRHIDCETGLAWKP